MTEVLIASDNYIVLNISFHYFFMFFLFFLKQYPPTFCQAQNHQFELHFRPSNCNRHSKWHWFEHQRQYHMINMTGSMQSKNRLWKYQITKELPSYLPCFSITTNFFILSVTLRPHTHTKINLHSLHQWEYCEITASHGRLLGKLPPFLYFLPLLGPVWLYLNNSKKLILSPLMDGLTVPRDLINKLQKLI